MLEYKGKYNVAKVFIDEIDQETVSQIYNMLNNEAFAGTKIRIMPDTHAGKGSTIGFTMNYVDKIIPNIIGVDIGCGVLCVELGNVDIDLNALDRFIYDNIPSGFSIHDNKAKNIKGINDVHINSFLKLAEKVGQDDNRCLNSIGTLGGGKWLASSSRV